VETDSPYLSPEPLRGKVNQPSHIIHTVSKLADLHKLSFDDMARQTKKNFLNLFNKIKE
jgi:TatD DNase family protein